MPSETPRPTLAAIASVFARYSSLTFGGNATMAVLHGELLNKRRWICPDDFMLCFALARLTPGTNVLAFCTGIGWRLRGLPGALAALLAASLPGGLIVIVAAALFTRWQGDRWVQAALAGAIAGSIAVTFRMCWTIVQPHWQGNTRLRVVLIGAGSFLAYAGLGVPAIYVLLLAAAFGAAVPAPRA